MRSAIVNTATGDLAGIEMPGTGRAAALVLPTREQARAVKKMFRLAGRGFAVAGARQPAAKKKKRPSTSTSTIGRRPSTAPTPPTPSTASTTSQETAP